MGVKPGYKRTEVGVIPEEWRDGTIADLEPYVTSGSRGWAEYYSDRGSAFLRITNLSRESIDLDLSDLKLVDLPPDDKEGLRTQLADGDLLISITADIGIVGHVGPRVPKPAYINQHIALIRFEESKADSKYLAYFLASERSQKWFRATTDQGAKAGMNLAGIRSIRVAFPSTDEQRAIATALSDVDALLTQLDRLIAKKRDIKQAAMQQLLTGKTRLPGFGGEWQVRRLGEHVTFLRNGVHSRAELTEEGSVKYLHYGDIHTSPRVRLDPAVTAMPCLPAHKAATLDRLRTGDLVFADASEDMEGVGKSVEIGTIDDSSELVSGLHTIAARFDRNTLADGFKAYLQFCPAFRSQLYRLAAGTKVYATTRNHIASIEIALPCLAEQTAIATLLSDLDAELAALEARRDKTRALKQGMMQELLTGRTRLI